MPEVRISSPTLGGLRVSQLPAPRGISTPQSEARAPRWEIPSGQKYKGEFETPPAEASPVARGRAPGEGRRLRARPPARGRRAPGAGPLGARVEVDNRACKRPEQRAVWAEQTRSRSLFANGAQSLFIQLAHTEVMMACLSDEVTAGLRRASARLSY